MPIKPENRHRYSKNWREIRAAVLRRANNRCEGSPLYPNCRARNYEPHPETRSVVILTIAHMDHTPENNDFTNLRALCQRCHLAHDLKLHNINRARAALAAKEKAGQLNWISRERDTDNCGEI